jgi:tetratricopeptide (TPR) repeat protein
MITLMAVGIGYVFLNPYLKYNEAMSLYERGNFEQSIRAFTNLEGYKNSPHMVIESKYGYANRMMEQENYSDAIELFRELGDYKDSSSLATEATYLLGKQKFASENYSGALAFFNQIKKYKDVSNLLLETTYLQAKKLYDSGDFTTADKQFKTIETYQDAKQYIENISFLERFQGTWESEFGFSQRIFSGWKVYSVYFPDSHDTSVHEWEYERVDNKLITSIGDIYTLANERTLIENDSGRLEEYARYNSSVNVPNEKPAPRIGMTAQEVRNSNWGSPNDINRTTTQFGVREQWVYNNYKYIYLEDGIVTSISE